MRALLSVMAGGPETLVLRELPEPSIGVGQVRIAVRNCGINYPDALIIEDKYQFRPPRPFAPGLEVSGVVEAVGQEVDALRVGDRVIATVPYGGLAEQLVADVDACMPMPDSMPFEVGAALVATYGTSYHALVNRGELQPGETLLVLGAAGGVGVGASIGASLAITFPFNITLGIPLYLRLAEALRF